MSTQSFGRSNTTLHTTRCSGEDRDRHGGERHRFRPPAAGHRGTRRTKKDRSVLLSHITRAWPSAATDRHCAGLRCSKHRAAKQRRRDVEIAVGGHEDVSGRCRWSRAVRRKYANASAPPNACGMSASACSSATMRSGSVSVTTTGVAARATPRRVRAGMASPNKQDVDQASEPVRRLGRRRWGPLNAAVASTRNVLPPAATRRASVANVGSR